MNDNYNVDDNNDDDDDDNDDNDDNDDFLSNLTFMKIAS